MLFIFALFCSLNPGFFGFVAVVHKFIWILCTFSKNIVQILTIETAGVSAFTNAEKVIAIGVLGIVATSVVPTFYANYEKDSIILKLQRNYAVYSNGVNLAISENGSPDNWELVGSGDHTGLSNLNKVLSKYFKININCGTGPGCFPDVRYKNLKGLYNETILNQDPLYTKFKMLDGTSVGITQWSADCDLKWGDSASLSNVCGLFVMDLNGEKLPNTYGKDFFGFALTKYGLTPLGSQMQNQAYPFNGFCNVNSNANFKYENGLSCTAWVLYNKNMEYLDCQGLNWNGKTTCKK